MKGSAAVYDTEGKLLAKSCDAIGDLASAVSTNGQKNGPFVLDDICHPGRRRKWQNIAGKTG